MPGYVRQKNLANELKKKSNEKGSESPVKLGMHLSHLTDFKDNNKNAGVGNARKTPDPG
ncbi:MAG: hypothetical protein P8166_02990 [Candidatus Thiodiazotropha sp.]